MDSQEGTPDHDPVSRFDDGSHAVPPPHRLSQLFMLQIERTVFHPKQKLIYT